MQGRQRRHRRGFTLPEALLAIVVLGVGLTGVMLAFNTTMRRGADPMLQLQMLAIAEGLMEEIQLKPFAAAANTAPTGCARDTFNNVADYDGYASTGICSVDGVAVPALAGFGVRVSVQAATLAGVNSALRITVTASQGSDSLQLVGWRTDYAAP